MEFFYTVRGTIVLISAVFLSLWLARQLKFHRQMLSVWAVLCLAFILLFEPMILAFSVWCLHEKAALNSALMIHAYTYLKASGFVYILFILPSIYFARQFYLKPSPLTVKALRFGLFLPVAFAAVVFWEAPQMIWGERSALLGHVTSILFFIVALANLSLLALTFIRIKNK